MHYQRITIVFISAIFKLGCLVEFGPTVTALRPTMLQTRLQLRRQGARTACLPMHSSSERENDETLLTTSIPSINPKL